MLVGLTGKRESGKSTLAKYLVENHGFKLMHAFDPGKAMIIAYYKYLGVYEKLAHEMVYGVHKDTLFEQMYFWQMDDYGDYTTTTTKTSNPLKHQWDCVADLVPGHNSRDFMEKFGRWMSVEMGTEYTLIAEYKRKKRIFGPDVKLVCESIVYEANDFRKLQDGAIIVKVNRPNHKGVVGLHTDKAVEEIIPDVLLVNDKELEDLYTSMDVLLETLNQPANFGE